MLKLQGTYMLRAFLQTGLIAIVCFLGTHIAHAQISSPSVDSAQIFVTPQYPTPGETVTVRVENYSININATEITWSLNNKVQKKGLGDKTFSFTAGPIGSVHTVTVSGPSFSKSVSIRPASLSISWQTNTYVPPFYKGKALYANQSNIQFVAIPEFADSKGVLIDPDTLIYTWTRNGSVIQNASGFGRRVFQTSGGTLAKSLIIEVEVNSVDGNIKAKKAIEVEGVSPYIVMYENHPLYGITYRTALPDTFTLTSKEISVVATPYFFDVSGVRSVDMSYVWKMNGKMIESQENPSIITLRTPTDSTGGKASISLSISHLKNMLQFTDKAFTITFSPSSEENI